MVELHIPPALSAPRRWRSYKEDEEAAICWQPLAECVSGDIARVSTSFEHPCDSSEVIQVIIDPPHIFKCIRNNLLKAGKFLLPSDKEVQHFHFEALLDYEEQQAGLRAVPKLTKAHIRPNAFQKLSVKLAVQASLL
ncbi:hypothetical protein HPB51_017827 [Rhipicephalus microplus]|uniref:Transposable element P transposase-like GTP-binding insertion domain-containing protein n=1 Tax=Rhipicephalus microplus TaxID=6941 RepID=A0A9J6E389_RHIMP|nr:hypothetical protein HPB51_017827 [Rhipicephalus microplus]